MDTSSLPDDLRFALKAATRDLVTLCGGLVRAGEVAGIGKSQLARYGSVDAPDIIDVWRALLLERECGAPRITRILAGAHGRALTEPDGGDGPGGLREAGLTAAVAMAEATATYARAVADGEVTPTEAAAIARDHAAAMEALGAVRQEVAPALGGRVIRLGVR